MQSWREKCFISPFSVMCRAKLAQRIKINGETKKQKKCTSSNWVHLKCSLVSFSRFRTLGSSHSWSCPPCCVPVFFGDTTPTSTVTSSLDSSSWYTFAAQSGPLLLMQYSPSNLILFSSTLYLLPLHPHHRLMLLAVSIYLLLPLLLLDFLRVL